MNRLPRWKTYLVILLGLVFCGSAAVLAGLNFWKTGSYHQSATFISGASLPLAGVILPPTQDQSNLQATMSNHIATQTSQSHTGPLTPTPTPAHIGIYESFSPRDPASLDRLEQIRQAGFNTVLNYDILDGSKSDITRYLDKAQELGLYIIFNVKDFYDKENNSDITLSDFAEYGATNDEIALGIVNTYKHHPAIYSWYISDERPESPQDTSWAPVIKQRYEQIKQADPQHPTMMALGCYQGENAAAWPAALPSLAAATDQIGFDSYPVPYAPLNTIGQCSHVLSQAVPSPANRWFVIQAFSWASYPDTVKSDGEDITHARYPSVDELTSMIKSAQQNGVQNLMFYSYFDLKNDTAYFNQSWSNLRQAMHNTGIDDEK